MIYPKILVAKMMIYFKFKIIQEIKIHTFAGFNFPPSSVLALFIIQWATSRSATQTLRRLKPSYRVRISRKIRVIKGASDTSWSGFCTVVEYHWVCWKKFLEKKLKKMSGNILWLLAVPVGTILVKYEFQDIVLAIARKGSWAKLRWFYPHPSHRNHNRLNQVKDFH